MRWTAWVVAGLALLTAGASAQAPPRRVALVISNAAYSSANVLTNPPNDARIVAAALQRAGFQTVDAKTNLGVAAFQTALRDFRNKADRAQVALIYYAGHGVEGNGKNWLIPTDAVLASERDLDYEAINLDLVLSALAGADLRVVILDACRNNPFGRSWKAGTRAFTRGLTGMEADDVLVIYAAAPGQTASDGAGGNSPFATSLSKRLPEPGLPIQMLGGLVRDDVIKVTAGAQRPYVSASITGTAFYFVEKQTPVQAAQAAPVNPCAAFDERWIGGLKASSDRGALQGFVASAPDQCISRDAAQLRLASLVTAPAAAPVMARSEQSGSFRDCPSCPLMVTIPAGSFAMGSPASESGRSPDESPQHNVRVAGFAAGAYEVTFEEWDACVADGGCDHYQPDDAGWGRGKRPAIYVSWNDAQKYVAWIKRKTGKTYRLLTEAEWEYSARAGQGAAYWWGDGFDKSRIANNGSKTEPVGSYPANAFGLYDTAGNVWEWVEDCYNASYNGAPTDGSAITTGSCSYRVYRGGSWYDLPANLRSAYRVWSSPTIRYNLLGFRVARTY